MITMGGNAELELVDSLDPFSEGILFSVMPPKKSWKNISNLSGGEKTLSSLALVFALHHYKPTPLYVMDEIDAALDFRNVSPLGFSVCVLPTPAKPVISPKLRFLFCFWSTSRTYGHRQQTTGHPVRSAIHKLLIGRLVVGSVTTSESLLLYVFVLFLFLLRIITANHLLSFYCIYHSPVVVSFLF